MAIVEVLPVKEYDLLHPQFNYLVEYVSVFTELREQVIHSSLIKPAEMFAKPAERLEKPAETFRKPAEMLEKPAERLVKPAEMLQICKLYRYKSKL